MTKEYLHEELFKMLCLLHDICEKENIDYYIDSGTLIGAAREQDFIPWDDDIDIVMKRRDYNRFREVVQKYLPGNIKLVEAFDYGGLFFDYIPRLVNTDIQLREETKEDEAYCYYNNRASIDIFLLDNTSNNSFLRKMQNLIAKFIYCLAMSKRYEVHSEDYSFAEKIVTGILIQIGKLFSLKTLIGWFEWNIQFYSKKDTDFYVYESIIKCLLIYPKDFYDEKTLIQFHGKEFCCPLKYDTVLRFYYGDYMTPVKEGFIVHADFEDD